MVRACRSMRSSTTKSPVAGPRTTAATTTGTSPSSRLLRDGVVDARTRVVQDHGQDRTVGPLSAIGTRRPMTDSSPETAPALCREDVARRQTRDRAP
jgi:hypothetical protein